jgi:hypothetical protein
MEDELWKVKREEEARIQPVKEEAGEEDEALGRAGSVSVQIVTQECPISAGLPVLRSSAPNVGPI